MNAEYRPISLNLRGWYGHEPIHRTVPKYLPTQDVPIEGRHVEFGKFHILAVRSNWGGRAVCEGSLTRREQSKIPSRKVLMRVMRLSLSSRSIASTLSRMPARSCLKSDSCSWCCCRRQMSPAPPAMAVIASWTESNPFSKCCNFRC